MGGQLGFLCKEWAGVGVYSCGGSWRREKDSGFLLNRPLSLQVDLTLIQDVLISTILGKIEDFEQSKLTGACYPLIDLVILF